MICDRCEFNADPLDPGSMANEILMLQGLLGKRLAVIDALADQIVRLEARPLTNAEAEIQKLEATLRDLIAAGRRYSLDASNPFEFESALTDAESMFEQSEVVTKEGDAK